MAELKQIMKEHRLGENNLYEASQDRKQTIVACELLEVQQAGKISSADIGDLHDD